MSCPRRLCNRMVFSDSVTFTDPNLLINIPQAAYNNGQRYCLVIAQSIPTTTTIAATVGITIGEDEDTIYPLVNPNCTNVNACEMVSKGIYPVVVNTSIQDGVFKLVNPVGCKCCSYNNAAAPSLPIPSTPTTVGGEG